MTSVKPETIMRNVYARLPSLVTLAGIKLDVFSRLSGNPMNAHRLAQTLKVAESRLSPLLYALVSVGMLRIEGGFFSNSEEAEAYFATDAEQYKAHICFLIDRVWKVVSKTAETIYKDKPQAGIDWSNDADHKRAELFKGQYCRALQAGKELGARFDFSNAPRILDSAGGSGGLAAGLYDVCQHVRLTIADLPEVVPFTEQFISDAGLAHRINVISADLVRQRPDGVYDAVVTRSFFQVLSPPHARAALINIGRAIAAGGWIYIIGYFLDNTRLFPRGSVAHNLMFLNLFEDGRAHTKGAYVDWLESAGFEDIQFEYTAFSDGAGMITARKI